MNDQVLGILMSMEYVRVRKSTMKEINEMLKKREKTDWHLLSAIVGMVVVVAIAGLVLAL